VAHIQPRLHDGSKHVGGTDVQPPEPRCGKSACPVRCDGGRRRSDGTPKRARSWKRRTQPRGILPKQTYTSFPLTYPPIPKLNRCFQSFAINEGALLPV
jgi:hypothetical protein